MSVGVVRERPLRELESEIRRAQALLALLKQSFSTPHEFPDQRLILSEQPLNTQVPLPSIRKNTNNDLVLVPLVSLFRPICVGELRACDALKIGFSIL